MKSLFFAAIFLSSLSSSAHDVTRTKISKDLRILKLACLSARHPTGAGTVRDNAALGCFEAALDQYMESFDITLALDSGCAQESVEHYSARLQKDASLTCFKTGYAELEKQEN